MIHPHLDDDRQTKIPFNDNRHPFFADSTNVHGNLSMPSLKVRVTGGLITQISLDEESQLFQDYFNFRFLKHFFVCVLKKTIINFSISHLLVAFSRLKMILEHLYQPTRWVGRLEDPFPSAPEDGMRSEPY